MSDYATLISSIRIMPPELTAFIRNRGGHISSEEHIEGGVTRPGGAIWFYGARKDLERNAVNVERRVLEKLGGVARARIDFELSSEPASHQIMLDVAVEFARTWPGVMQCAMHRVIEPSRIADVMAEGTKDEEKLILGPEARLCFVTDVEDRLMRSLANFEGVRLCAPGGEAVVPTTQTLMASNISGLDSDDVMGWAEVEGGKVWLSHLFEAEPPEEQEVMAKRVSAAVREKLGEEARYVSMLAIGYGASKATEGLCLRLAQRILEESPGVAVGLFDSVLDVEAIRRLASAGRGFVD